MQQNRFLGLDILRLASLFAIVVFHSYEAVFWLDQQVLTLRQSIYPIVEAPARVLSISGFTIVILTLFLHGFRSGHNRKYGRLPIFFVAGAIIFAVVQAIEPGAEPYWEWDIYWFLLAGWLSLALARRSRSVLLGLTGLGFVFLWIPLWKWTPPVGPWLQNALVGVCHRDEGGGNWPLLPWIGLVWLPYGVGHFLARQKSLHWRSFESWIWPPLLLLSLPRLGHYMATPIGPHFSCFMLRQNPIIFWSHAVWIALTIRLSLIPTVNAFLLQRSWSVWISSLAINRHFWLGYFVHFVLISIGAWWRSEMVEQPRLFDIYLLMILPATEAIVRGLMRIYDLLSSSSKDRAGDPQRQQSNHHHHS